MQNGVTCSSSDSSGVGNIVPPNGDGLSLQIAVTKKSDSSVEITTLTGNAKYQVLDNDLTPNYNISVSNRSKFSIYKNSSSNTLGASDEEGDSISVTNGVFNNAELDFAD